MKSRFTEKASPAKVNKEFLQNVKEGLSAPSKFINSKFFYDKKGDQIFQEIMALPEYYLTESEREVLEIHKQDILEASQKHEHFELVDLGSGDGYKTKILLDFLRTKNISFTYRPVDISSSSVDSLTDDLSINMPEINVQGISEPFSSALTQLNTATPKLFLFLGASIGNYTFEESAVFLRRIKEVMGPKDHLMVGFDLRKDPDVILAAYNDSTGVTKRFNLNLLERINREMGADFDLDLFDHTPLYDESSGEARSFLTSLADQVVTIPALKMIVKFKKGEKIATEISRKYSFLEIDKLAGLSGFTVTNHFTDSKGWFTDSLWKIII